jgi:hypothetical protein
MPYTTHGLPNTGSTPHFNVAYDDASPLDGREAATALLGMCEDDYDLMSRWFRGVSIGRYRPLSRRHRRARGQPSPGR